ncbi:MAG: T9SS type A sorting domain-containing protein [Candidatus Eisenbacteria bacterium]
MALVAVTLTIGTSAAHAGGVTRSGDDAAVRPAGVAGVDNSHVIDANNIRMFVTNTGSFAWNKTTGSAGLEFPRGTGNTAVFAAGLWMGARVGGTTRVVVSEYSDEYGPGAMVGTIADDPNRSEYRVYKLYRLYSTTFQRDAALADYNAGAVPHGAPAVTVQGDGSLSILGDQMLWAVYNDADPTHHTNRAGSTLPLGVEVRQTTFAFNRPGALGNTVFISYKIVNKGGNTLDSTYVSLWSDPDDGSPVDDLVGCDTTLGVGFVYNSTNSDLVYGAQPPSVGYDFIHGPVTAGDTLGLTSFNKYTNGTDPDSFPKTYNLMKGLASDGSPRINPMTGQPTTFMYSGDPVVGSGWLDSDPPQDVRMQLSSGPFTMMPGDTQTVLAAIVIGQGPDRLASISAMKYYDTQIQSAFDHGFTLAVPPPSSPARLTLAAPRPNPTTSVLGLDFACARPGPARIEVFDVTGRRVFARDLGVLDVGPHHESLDLSARSTGLYLVRVRQADEVAQTRVLVMR